MHCDLTDLYIKQKELDLEIANNHHISYESTYEKRVLALLVELGELANATRTFKFWSNKGPETKERVLDEYADGLHFLLSIGLAYHYQVDSIEVDEEKVEPTDAILKSYHYINEFYNDRNLSKYLVAFEFYLKILASLGYTWSEAYDAYFKKLEENRHRQDTNY